VIALTGFHVSPRIWTSVFAAMSKLPERSAEANQWSGTLLSGANDCERRRVSVYGQSARTIVSGRGILPMTGDGN